MASLNIYAMLAWLPTIMQQHLGLDRVAAGVAFSIYSDGLHHALVANKLKHPMPLAGLLAATFQIDYWNLTEAVRQI